MAIEIREVVIRATVNKSAGGLQADLITKADLQKLQDKFMSKILSRVKDLIEEQRAFR